ncbi:MAG: response regulator [Chloroflexota bacterium]
MDTVMIVGRSPDFSYLMQRYVRRSGHRTVLANADAEVLAVARRERPAVIVLEAESGEEPQWQTLDALRTDQLTADIPVVVCSWLDRGARALQRQGVVYLRKPVLYGDLVTALIETGVTVRAEDLADGPSPGRTRDDEEVGKRERGKKEFS